MKTSTAALCFVAIIVPSVTAIDLTTWFKASNNYYYKVYEKGVSYSEAKQACAAMGAQLATVGIRDPGVRSEWIKHFDRNKAKHLWFGLNDLAKQFDWTFLDGKKACNNDEFWHANEPNNYNNNNERCALMWYVNSEWSANDGTCHTKHGYVCEYLC